PAGSAPLIETPRANAHVATDRRKDITTPQAAPASGGYSMAKSISRSPSSSLRMNPAGFPFLAGSAVIFRNSPGLMDALLTPARVNTRTAAVVNTHSVVVPSG